MQSVMVLIEFMSPVVTSCPSDATILLASIQSRISSVESIFFAPSSAVAELSVESHACIVFIRALDQLRTAAYKMFSDLKYDEEITDILIKIRSTGNLKGFSFLPLFCNLVIKGRNYLSHGADMHKTFSLLLCTCAAASLLRFLYKDTPFSPKFKNDADSSSGSSLGSATSTTPSGIVLRAPSSVCEPAEQLEASVKQLLERMCICDTKLLVHEIVKNHSEM